jgi:hypothetical protein
VDTCTVTLIGYSTAGNDTFSRANYIMARGTPTGLDEGPAPGLLAAAAVHVLPEPMTNFIRFTLNEKLAVAGTEVVILNSAGRLVRRLTGAVGRDVTANLWWNGRDESGLRMGPGIYVYQVTGAGETVTGRIVKVK